MSEMKIYMPNNNIEPDGSLTFPKDFEDFNSNSKPSETVINIPKISDQKFKFSEEDTISKNLFEEEGYSHDFVDSSEKYGDDLMEQSVDKVKSEPNQFLSLILAKVDKLVSIENIIFGFLVFTCLYIRNIFVPFLSGDVTNFLSPWMDYIESHNGFFAFEEKFFDYSPSYIYILWAGTLTNFSHVVWIKGISIFFDMIAASAIARIIYLKNPQLWKYAFITTLIFPSVLFNGSMWGQCDGIYSTFAVLSLLGVLTQKYFRSFFFFGIALTFKLQAIFFAPLFWFLILFKNLKARSFIYLASISTLIYGGSVLPAYLVGRPLLDEVGKNNGLLTIYFNQGKVYSGIVMGAIPNLYQWIDNAKYEYFYPFGVVLTLIIFGILSLIFVKTKVENISSDTIVKLAYLSALMVPYFLPKMHERYMFLADLLCLVYVFWFPKRFWVGIIAGLVSYSIYIKHIIGGSVPLILEPQFNSIYILGIMGFLLWEILEDLKLKIIK